jgi:hypothetical protein
MKRAFTGAGDENKAGFGGSEPEIEPIGGRNAEQELDVGAAQPHQAGMSAKEARGPPDSRMRGVSR